MNTILINNEQQLSAPDEAKIIEWASAALKHMNREQAELSISIVDELTIRELNRDYRNKDKTTNVLSFYTDIPEELGLNILGDIIICPAVVEAEATEFSIELSMRWAHMVVHGTLHLLGFDHIESDDQQEMEAIETQILNSWGYTCPYLTNN